MPTIKTEGDLQLGSVATPQDADLLYILRSPYEGPGLDGYIRWSNLSSALGASGVPVFNALTDPDSNIVADYVDRLNPGTGQRQNFVDWIQNGIAAGKTRFFVPPGHFNIDEGVGDSSSVADVQGYDDIEIYGVAGQTFLHTPQGQDIRYKANPFIRFGWQQKAEGCRLHGITFINDPYATNSRGSIADNDIQWGWKYYEPHRVSQEYQLGEYIVSSDDNWLILVTAGGTSDAVEPTWTAGTTIDGTCTVVVVALANWLPSTPYAQGAHAKTTLTTGGNAGNGNQHDGERSIMWASNAGTSGATANEPLLALPSADGASTDWDTSSLEWASFGTYAKASLIYDLDISGMAGFGDAGGTAFGWSGTGGGLCENCTFHDAQYGGVVSGLFQNWTIRDCTHYKLGGWGWKWGTYNAHGYYCQGARNLWDDCNFDMHYYGLDIKFHANPPNNDVWQNRVINSRFSNPGWGSIEWVTPTLATSESAAPDFVLPATSGSDHSAVLCKQGEVIGCTFRVFKSVWDNYDWRRPTFTPNGGTGFAIKSSCTGINISACDFTDIQGCFSGVDAGLGTFNDNTPLFITGCSFETIFRKTTPLDGQWSADNCMFDFRAVLGWQVGIRVRDYCRLTNSTVAATTTQTGNQSYGVILIEGSFTTVANVKLELKSTGHPFAFGQNARTWVSVKNNDFIAPSGTIYANPSGSSKWWIFENNYWEISGWDYARFDSAGQQTWTWRNEKGNLFTSRWDATNTYKDYNSGVIRAIGLPDRSYVGAAILIDQNRNTIGVGEDGNIYGVSLLNSAHGSAGSLTSPYHSWVAVSKDANHWVATVGLVGKYDWITLAGSGKISTNGTSGSTTKPTSGIIARVIDVGTAGAGDGYCQIEVILWNLPSGGSLPSGGASGLSLVKASAGEQDVEWAARADPTAKQTWDQAQSYGEPSITWGASIAWNAGAHPCARIILTGNATLAKPTGAEPGSTYVLRVIQDATGGRTLAYAPGIVWPNKTPPEITPGVGEIDILTFYVGDDGDFYGAVAPNFG